MRHITLYNLVLLCADAFAMSTILRLLYRKEQWEPRLATCDWDLSVVASYEWYSNLHSSSSLVCHSWPWEDDSMQISTASWSLASGFMTLATCACKTTISSDVLFALTNNPPQQNCQTTVPLAVSSEVLYLGFLRLVACNHHSSVHACLI